MAQHIKHRPSAMGQCLDAQTHPHTHTYSTSILLEYFGVPTAFGCCRRPMSGNTDRLKHGDSCVSHISEHNTTLDTLS